MLTEVSAPSGALELPEGIQRALILFVRRDQVLAELGEGGARRVALAAGEYAVRAWKGTQAFSARVAVAAGEVRKVTWSELQPVASPPVASKGSSAPAGLEGLDALSPEARAEYDAKYFTVGDVLVHGRGEIHSSAQISRGRYLKETDEGEFLREVGRPDLAEAYESRSALRATLGWGGLALEIGSLTVGVALLKGANLSDESRQTIGNVCIGAIVAGGVAMIGSLFVDPHPVAPDEIPTPDRGVQSLAAAQARGARRAHARSAACRDPRRRPFRLPKRRGAPAEPLVLKALGLVARGVRASPLGGEPC